MSIYDHAGFDQWGFDREGKDAGGNRRVTDHPAGLRPPARPAVLGPEPANPAAALLGQHIEHGVEDVDGKLNKGKKADHHALLAGKPREGNDPEPPARVGATTAGSSRTGVAQTAQATVGVGGIGGPTFPTPAQEEEAEAASQPATPKTVSAQEEAADKRGGATKAAKE